MVCQSSILIVLSKHDKPSFFLRSSKTSHPSSSRIFEFVLINLDVSRRRSVDVYGRVARAERGRETAGRPDNLMNKNIALRIPYE